MKFELYAPGDQYAGTFDTREAAESYAESQWENAYCATIIEVEDSELT